jgi:hypothetical protein
MTADDDLIRRADALAVMARHGLQFGKTSEAFHEVAALPSVQPGVTVKPLEWQVFEGRGAKARAWKQANYLIAWWKSRQQFEVVASYPGYQGEAIGAGFYPTLEAAKAAAQADYEARILAALTPQPAPDVAGWQPIETAPKDKLIDLRLGDKLIRLGDALDAVYRADSLELATYGESRIAERIAAIEPVQHLDESSIKPGQLFFDGDGDVCVAADGDNLVFCPAVDDEGRNVLHPEIIAKLVQLYNDHDATALTATAVGDSRAPEAGDKVAGLTEEIQRLRYVLEGVRGAIKTGRNEPIAIWLDQIEIALAAGVKLK